MAETDKIIVEYVADIQGFRAQLKSVEESMKKVETTTKQTAQATTKEFQKTSDSIKQGAGQILAAVGVAFGTAQVIAFGKESIKAFTEAEANANKLRFAVEKIGGEGSSAFQKLIKQSEELQKTTIFSDDSIQQAQTALSTFGLTSDQIEALIPQIADLASATGTDLVSATEKAIQGINGQTRGLKSVGITFADTGSKTENLAILTDKLTKFQGASSEALETTAGKAKRLENAFDDIQEKIGEYLVGAGADILDNFEALGNFADVFSRKESEKFTSAMDKVNEKTLKSAQESEEKRLAAIEATNKNIIVLEQNLASAKNDAEKKIRTDLLNNQKKLLSDLNVLNQKQVIEDDKTLGGLKVEKAEDLNKVLRDLETANIRSNYERRKAEIQNNFDDEAQKYAGNLEILTQLDIKRENALLDLYNEREKEYEKIRKEGANKSVEIFKASAEEMKAEDTSLAVHVKNNQDDIVKKVEEAEKRKQRAQEQTQNAISSSIDSLGQLSQNLTEQELIDLDKKTEKEISSLEYQLDHKLITQQEYDSKVAALEKKKDEEQRRLRKEQFETDRQIAIAKIIIATAQAVITQFAETGYYGAILAGVVGAAELAVVASQPTPKFEKGGKVKGKRHSAGGTLIEAEVDEFVVKRDEAMKNDPLLNAINKGKADSFIYDFYVAPALKAQQKKNAENREKSFANNLAGSLGFNFKDKNLLESLKQSRKNDRENTLFLAKELKPKGYDARRF